MDSSNSPVQSPSSSHVRIRSSSNSFSESPMDEDPSDIIYEMFDQGEQSTSFYCPDLKQIFSGNSVPAFALASSAVIGIGNSVVPSLFLNCDTSGFDYHSPTFKVAVVFAGIGVLWCSAERFVQWLEANQLSKELVPQESSSGVRVDQAGEGSQLIDKGSAPPCPKRLHKMCINHPNLSGGGLGLVFGPSLFIALISTFLDKGLCNLGPAAYGSALMISMGIVAGLSLMLFVGGVFSQCLNGKLLESVAESQDSDQGDLKFTKDDDGKSVTFARGREPRPGKNVSFLKATSHDFDDDPSYPRDFGGLVIYPSYPSLDNPITLTKSTPE